MPWADDPASVIDFAVTERSTLMRAMIVESPPSVGGAADGEGSPAGHHGCDAPNLELAGVDLVPFRLRSGFVHVVLPSMVPEPYSGVDFAETGAIVTPFQDVPQEYRRVRHHVES